ncbi:helix-turn-helix domain-containing protein [Calderihabitans maritimus]|uniref:MerR family transcriptional regulator n=1 Tax=Calderihabitans maritimus TaxID=1246530 RepID=A0A1Z5HWU2_9FIRM|nr:cupin domain-containing protein [Calderihabitans maritimus]GAW93801.1 MerR family transcriptional regulator [Calderihabitans maritimus]
MTTFGQRLRQCRLEKGLTLQEVAQKTGLSLNYLSRVENDKVNITISTLLKLAKCYQKNPASFFSDSFSNAVRLVRKKERHSLGLDRGAELQVLLVDDAQSLEVLKIDLEPGNESAEMSYPGETFIVVTKGKLTVVVDDEEYVLQEGDSLRFEGGITHQWKNADEHSVTFLVIMTPSKS